MCNLLLSHLWHVALGFSPLARRGTRGRRAEREGGELKALTETGYEAIKSFIGLENILGIDDLSQYAGLTQRESIISSNQNTQETLLHFV